MRVFVAFLSRPISSRVVLVAIDVAAHLILLMIHLGAFLTSQVSTVGRAVVVHFLMNRRFFAFQVARLTRRQLARANALADTRLLIAFPFVDAAVRRVCGPAVIFGREVGAVHAGGVFVRNL